MNKQIIAGKEAVVSTITESIKNAQSVSVVEYRGLTVAQVESLRKELRKVGSEMKVFKNTLVTRAVDSLGYQELDDGSHIYAVEITGADCSTAWEDEYFIDLVVAGFIQDNSYSYEDGYGYIFAAPDSSCLVQFFYVPDVNTFVIYIYTA